jgi:hypothetical protein
MPQITSFRLFSGFNYNNILFLLTIEAKITIVSTRISVFILSIAFSRRVHGMHPLKNFSRRVHGMHP